MKKCISFLFFIIIFMGLVFASYDSYFSFSSNQGSEFFNLHRIVCSDEDCFSNASSLVNYTNSEP